VTYDTRGGVKSAERLAGNLEPSLSKSSHTRQGTERVPPYAEDIVTRAVACAAGWPGDDVNREETPSAWRSKSVS